MCSSGKHTTSVKSSSTITRHLTASGTASSSTSNKILVQFNVNCQCAPTASAGSVAVTVFRGSGINTSLSGTNLAGSGSQNTTGAFCIHNAGVGTNSSSDNCVSASYIDSPSSTSSVTYTIAFRKVDSSGDARLGGRGAFSTMTLMEIKG